MRQIRINQIIVECSKWVWRVTRSKLARLLSWQHYLHHQLLLCATLLRQLHRSGKKNDPWVKHLGGKKLPAALIYCDVEAMLSDSWRMCTFGEDKILLSKYFSPPNRPKTRRTLTGALVILPNFLINHASYRNFCLLNFHRLLCTNPILLTVICLHVFKCVYELYYTHIKLCACWIYTHNIFNWVMSTVAKKSYLLLFCLNAYITDLTSWVLKTHLQIKQNKTTKIIHHWCCKWHVVYWLNIIASCEN